MYMVRQPLVSMSERSIHTNSIGILSRLARGGAAMGGVLHIRAQARGHCLLSESRCGACVLISAFVPASSLSKHSVQKIRPQPTATFHWSVCCALPDCGLWGHFQPPSCWQPFTCVLASLPTFVRAVLVIQVGSQLGSRLLSVAFVPALPLFAGIVSVCS